MVNREVETSLKLVNNQKKM